MHVNTDKVHEMPNWVFYAGCANHVCRYKCEDVGHCDIRLRSSCSGHHHPQVDKAICF